MSSSKANTRWTKDSLIHPRSSSSMSWFLKVTLLLLFVASSAQAFAKSTPPAPLSFIVAPDISLKPQDLPPFLHDYHTQAIAFAGEAFEDTDMECIRDISYGPKAHQRLDVWKTSKSTSIDRPVVVFFHGGGWDWGYKEWAALVAKNLCTLQDAILVTPSYAIGQGAEVMWPDAQNDGIAVMKWVQGTISEYGGDPNRMVFAGHSAGGHLAASTGLDTALLQSNNMNPKSIRALFLISAPLGVRAQDFMGLLYKFPVTRPLANFVYRKTILKFLRPLVGENDDLFQAAKDASPLATLENNNNNNVNSSTTTAPFVHYTYGAKGDFPICRSHLRKLQKLLGENQVQGLELAVTSHFDTHFALADPDCEWHTALQQVLQVEQSK